MEINFVELWDKMGFPVRSVVCVLAVQGLACLAVVFDRLFVLAQARRQARSFVGLVQRNVESAEYEAALKSAKSHKSNPLANYLSVGLDTFLNRARAGDSNERAAEFSRRALERKGESLSRQLNRGMNVLASTGSTAPFVGLLGTVLGIINAFRLIAESGSGGIGTIGAAIGEALVVTGFGLVVAIPSVLAFNWLSGRIAAYEGGLLNAGGELLDRLEMTHGGIGELAGGAEANSGKAVLTHPVSPSAAG